MSSNASGIWLALAAASAAVAVAAGAFAAHGLAWRGAQAVEWMRTGSQYQMWHALATVAAAALARRTGAGEGTGTGRWPSRALSAAAGCWIVGTVLFCGALYGLALGGPRWLGAVAPLGGGAFLLGWAAAAVAGWRMRTPD